MLTFLHHPDVEPTNNRAERALRPAIARKVSHCSKNTRGAEATLPPLPAWREPPSRRQRLRRKKHSVCCCAFPSPCPSPLEPRRSLINYQQHTLFWGRPNADHHRLGPLPVAQQRALQLHRRRHPEVRLLGALRSPGDVE
ncbi:MAG: transposase [Bryobacteraceae bacterium]|nr:transposase [Bryobacteraceae bacterium]